MKIGETASFFNLNNILDKKIDELSGGEKATVCIASAMIYDTQALLLDEPLSQLDPKSVITVSSLLKGLTKNLELRLLLYPIQVKTLLIIAINLSYLKMEK